MFHVTNRIAKWIVVCVWLRYEGGRKIVMGRGGKGKVFLMVIERVGGWNLFLRVEDLVIEI